MGTDFSLIRKYTATLPVQVDDLARELGITVKYIKMADKISGKLVNRGDSPPSFEIHVNKRHGINRQRFTLAHEIAHFILHRDLIEDSVIDNELYRSEKFSQKPELESQANAFAADLLMPKKLIALKYNELAQTWRSSEEILAEMASHFIVSREAMRIRIRMVVQLEIPT